MMELHPNGNVHFHLSNGWTVSLRVCNPGQDLVEMWVWADAKSLVKMEPATVNPPGFTIPVVLSVDSALAKLEKIRVGPTPDVVIDEYRMKNRFCKASLKD